MSGSERLAVSRFFAKPFWSLKLGLAIQRPKQVSDRSCKVSYLPFATRNNSWISSTDENPEVLFPTDEVANEDFNNNFSVLPNFVPMDAFQHVKNSGVS